MNNESRLSFAQPSEKSVLIFGASGFLGYRLTEMLLERGHAVTAVVRPGQSALDKLSRLSSALHIFEADLSRDYPPFELPDVKVVFTLAQSRHFRKFPEDAQQVFDINVRANLRIWKWAASVGIPKLVHASSGGIYRSQERIESFSESDELEIANPPDFYTRSKVFAEQLIDDFRSQFESTLIVRPFFLFGPSQSSDRLVGRIGDAIRRREPIPVPENGEVYLNPSFIDDAARLFADSVDLEGHEITNCAGLNVVSLRELATLIGDLLGVPPIFREEERPSKRWVGSIEHQTKLFGAPEFTIDRGLARCFSRTN